MANEEMPEGGADGEFAPPGQIPVMKGDVWDAQTIVVDGLAGVSISQHNTKIALAEHLPVDEELAGKYVMNLVIPNDQFLKILEILNAAAVTIRHFPGKDE